MNTIVKKKLSNLLSKDYKENLIRSFLEKRIQEENYDKNDIGVKNSKNIKEDIAKIYDFNEVNYKNKFLELLKRNAKESNSEDNFPNLKILVQDITSEELDKYIKIKTDDFGEKQLIIGSLIGDEYNNNCFSYCLSTEDKIKGRILQIPLQKLSEETIKEESEPTASPIVDGVILECSCGTSPTPLKVTFQSNLSMKGKFTATEKDNIANTNILPFGNCKNLPKQPTCPLSITGKWENTSKTFTIKGGAVLLDCSSMKCTLGGEIKPNNGVGYWKSR
ncbi:MAG: DUF4280 domain-containing protein [Cetobacterium sp.]